MIRPIIFGKFVLLERLSVGGMAEIYRAKLLNAPQFKRFLVIKRILPSLASDQEFINMFIDEARISVELNHPNICQIYELGRLRQAHYMVMEYIPGHDLLSIQQHYRRQRKIMSVSQACFIVMQVAMGLDYAHRALDHHGDPLGIVHRDISPQNVLVSYEGVVKLIDFGVAKAASRNSKTQSGVLKGKFGYMSPEQAEANAPIDHRSDLFGLGVVLWELLTGRRLFHGENEYDTLEKVRACNVIPPSDFNHMVTPAIDAIVMRALQPDPNYRYPSGADMANDLWAYIDSCNPPYTQGHLQHWMCNAFSGELEKEWEKIQLFDKINQVRDVHQFNIVNSYDDIEDHGEVVDFEGNVVPALEDEEEDFQSENTHVFTVPVDYNQMAGEASEAMPSRGDGGQADGNAASTQSQAAELASARSRSRATSWLVAIAALLALGVLGGMTYFLLVKNAGEEANAAPSLGKLSIMVSPASPDVRVELRDPSNDRTIKALRGQVSNFEALEYGRYLVVAQHPLYEPVEQIVELDKSQKMVTVDLQTRKSAKVHIKLTPKDATWTQDGQPIQPDALPDGRFELRTKVGEDLHLKLQKNGYYSKSIVVKADDLKPSTPFEHDPIELDKGEGMLTVKVTNVREGRADIIMRVGGQSFTMEAPLNRTGLDPTKTYEVEIRRKRFKPLIKTVTFNEANAFRVALEVELERE